MILEVTFLEFLLNCLRCKNCEYITVFILFYPCGLFTSTIVHPQQVTVLVPEIFIQMCKQEQEINSLVHNIFILYATPQDVVGHFRTKFRQNTISVGSAVRRFCRGEM